MSTNLNITKLKLGQNTDPSSFSVIVTRQQ